MRVELSGIRYWRHDLSSCLHTTAGVLLGFHGLDPLAVLGAAWRFYFDPADLRREEYYFPCPEGSLLAGLAPYHPVSSQWHAPVDAAAGWDEVRGRVAGGQPVAVAADNFYLPFRPAYRDVHTNHLITVYGFDDERGEALVADPVPPRFQGAIRIDELTAARDSANPVRHDRDMFFTDNPIGNRWFDVRVDAPQPPYDRSFVHRVVAANIAAFQTGSAGERYAGLAGQAGFLTWIADRLAGGEEAAIDTTFVLAGPVLAGTGLHAEWLAEAGRRFGWPELLEAGRAVDRVAHHWSAIRITVGAARGDPREAAEPMRRRADALGADHERALDLLDKVEVS
jgi:hypothetical protein